MRRYKRHGWQIADVCQPEEDGVYIVTDTRGRAFAAEYRENGYGTTSAILAAMGVFPLWRDLYTLEEFYADEVTAWQELPEPFEG